jgi:hypothetical protein
VPSWKATSPSSSRSASCSVPSVSWQDC